MERCQESWGHFWSASSAGPSYLLFPGPSPASVGSRRGRSSDTLKHKLSPSFPSGGWTETIPSAKKVPSCSSSSFLLEVPPGCALENMQKDQQVNKQLHPGCPQIHRLTTPTNFILAPGQVSKVTSQTSSSGSLVTPTLDSGATRTWAPVSVQQPRPGAQSIATSLKVPSGLAGTTWTKVL